MLIEARCRSERDPPRRRNLESLLAFWRALVGGDVAAVMRVMTPDVRVVSHGDTSQILNAEGVDAVRDYYERVVAAGVNRIEFDVEDLVVDARAACAAGRARMPYPGNLLRILGHAVDDPQAFYVYQAQVAMIWALDEQGRVREQASYAAGNGFADIGTRKLIGERLPPGGDAAAGSLLL